MMPKLELVGGRQDGQQYVFDPGAMETVMRFKCTPRGGGRPVFDVYTLRDEHGGLYYFELFGEGLDESDAFAR
ncbi:MAG: hypothetical protein ACR2RE_13170 [Geminicoccaceae bacterium]